MHLDERIVRELLSKSSRINTEMKEIDDFVKILMGFLNRMELPKPDPDSRDASEICAFWIGNLRWRVMGPQGDLRKKCALMIYDRRDEQYIFDSHQSGAFGMPLGCLREVVKGLPRLVSALCEKVPEFRFRIEEFLEY